MKKIFYIFYILSFLLLTSHAEVLKKETIISKKEDIKYLSQKIANDYLLLYYQPQKQSYKTNLQNAIKELEDDFRFIARNSSDTETKNVLDFLSYTKDQMKETLTQKISKKTVLDMLDYSDAMLEGVTSTLKAESKNIKFHLAKISKLYLAKNFDTLNNKDAFKKEVELLDKKLATKPSWISYKALVNKRCFIPYVTTILLNDIESNIK